MNPIRLHHFNTLVTGIALAIILPVIVYFIAYYAKVQEVSFALFSNHLIIGNFIPVIISHCILPNLVLFFIFNGLNWMQAAKGVMGTTAVLTVLIFAIKLVYSII